MIPGFLLRPENNIFRILVKAKHTYTVSLIPGDGIQQKTNWLNPGF